MESVLRSDDGRSEETYRIALIHSPRYLNDAAGAGFDLVLSGHYHGGTIRLPDGSGLMTPQYQFFVKTGIRVTLSRVKNWRSIK